MPCSTAGVPANSVSVDQVSPGGITIPGRPVKKGDNGGSGLSTGAIVGIAIGAVAVLALLRKDTCPSSSYLRTFLLLPQQHGSGMLWCSTFYTSHDPKPLCQETLGPGAISGI